MYHHECTLCPLGSHVWQPLQMLLCSSYAHSDLFKLVPPSFKLFVILARVALFCSPGLHALPPKTMCLLKAMAYFLQVPVKAHLLGMHKPSTATQCHTMILSRNTSSD